MASKVDVTPPRATEIQDFLAEKFPRLKFAVERIFVDSLPLTALQRGMVLQSLSASGHGAAIGQLEGAVLRPVDTAVLCDAWLSLVADSPVLRTLFFLADDDFQQKFVSSPCPGPVVEDWCDVAGAEQDRRFAALKEAERRRGFDSDSPALVRLVIIKSATDHLRLLWSFHNAILDEHSLALVLGELGRRYDVLAAGGNLDKREADRGFIRFICWRQSNDLAPAREFWRAALAGFDSPSELQCERVGGRKESATRDVIRCTAVLPSEASQSLQAAAKQCGLSQGAIILGAWSLLLWQHAASNRIICGIPRSCRESSLPGAEQVLGMAVNTVPFCVVVDPEETLAAFLTRVGRQERALVPHEHLALQEIRQLSEISAGEAMFETLLAYQEHSPAAGLEPDCGLGGDYRYQGQSGLPLALSVTGGKELRLELEQDPEVFGESVGPALLDHFVHLLGILPDHLTSTVAAVPAVTPPDWARMKGWNATEEDYPQKDLLLHNLFEQTAAAQPDRVAVVAGDQKLTYRELNERANRLAHFLQSLGIGPGVPVGIYMDRSLEMVTAIYGILKAGGAYLPLDPDYPQARLEMILADAQPQLVLTQSHLATVATALSDRVQVLDSTPAEMAEYPTTNPVLALQNDLPAYIIFTSGSTGRPKGVVNSHAGICNRILWMQAEFLLDEADRVLQKTPFSFDVSVWEFFWPLAVGARLVVAPPGSHRDPRELVRLIEEYGITTLHFVPTMMQALLETVSLAACHSLKRVLNSGEALSVALMERFHANSDADLINLYGPTEAAVDVTCWHCERGVEVTTVPIGRPIANTQLYILDERLRPRPLGVAGELFIGGVQVALGYLNQADLTAERFLPDPFAGAGGRMYRTGDLARFRPDGCLEFLGRNDSQVKIRGLRIELGDIEAAVCAHPAASQCVVTVLSPTADDQRLLAYVVPQEGQLIDTSELRACCAGALPEYMVPQHFMVLAQMPVTASGKVDRRSLPAWTEPQPTGAAGGEAARSGPERFLQAKWCQLLGLPDVGVRERFFEIGGTSLKAIQFIAWLSEELGEVVPIAGFFAAPTIAALVETLESEHAAGLRQLFPDHVPGQQSDLARANGHLPAVAAAEREDVAIIGMAGRFPGAADVDALWANLVNGVESVRFATDEQLLLAGVSAPAFNDEDFVRAYFSADGLDGFDADFFGLRPAEIITMDPQHRLFLELAWTALDNAGYARSQARDEHRIGVFGGIARDSYAHNFVAHHPRTANSMGEFQTFTGNDKNFPATRVAYRLNLKGPAVNVQTACSTSGVALHLACQNLQLGECDMALVGGCRVLVPARCGYPYFEGSALSATGHLHTFDSRATGMVRGSGGGFILIKRLSAARRDGDYIHGIVKSTAINNDGNQKAGFTAPSVQGQSEVIVRALNQAGVDPGTIDYVETHGTATPIGDPIEVMALTRAFRQFKVEAGGCWLGSVKTNVGHLDAGAAVTGIMKTILSLGRGQIPPSLHYEQPNPEIDFASSPFRVAKEPVSWPRHTQHPRRAGVSAFGLGGTNFHAVLEEAPAEAVGKPDRRLRRPCLITLSAKSEVSLKANLAGLVEFTGRHPELNPVDIAFSLNTCRPGFEYRAFVVCHSDEEISVPLLSRIRIARPVDRLSRLVCFFPGETGGSAANLRELVTVAPELEVVVAECYGSLPDGVVGRGAARNVGDWLHDVADGPAALFTLEYTLARHWLTLGVEPDDFVGSGIGEVVAACLKGEVDLGGALSLATGGVVRSEPDSKGTALSGQADTLMLTIGATGGDALTNVIHSLPQPTSVGGLRFALAEAAGTLWAQGQGIDWQAFYRNEPGRKVPLPPFRFARHRYWLDLPGIGPKLVLVGAPSAQDLDQTVQRSAEFLTSKPETALADLGVFAPGLASRYRLGLVGLAGADTGAILGESERDPACLASVRTDPQPVAFLLPGGGSQYLDMGLGLYDRCGDFRAETDRGLASFGARTGYDLKKVWFPADHERELAAREMQRPSVQLPAIFILEMALTRLWQSWGLQPAALLGHSLGENTAACVSGVIDYEDALGLVTLRGQLFEKTAPGGMLSIPLAPPEIQPYLGSELDLGTINAPEQCTVTGPLAAIDDLLCRLEAADIDAARIPITTAPHSRLLDPILEEFGDYLRGIELSKPQIPFLSNLSGDWITDEQATSPDYWVRHLRETVRFGDCVAALDRRGDFIALETGPGKILGSLVKAQSGRLGGKTVPSLRHPQDDTGDETFLLHSLNRLVSLNAALDLKAVERDLPGRLLMITPESLAAAGVPELSAPALNLAGVGGMMLSAPVAMPPNVISSNESVSKMTRPELIKRKLRAVLSDLSGLDGDALDNELPFLQMGFDSLFLTQANLKFKKIFKVKITLRQLLRESPTISALAAFVESKLPADAFQDELQAPSAPAAGTSQPTLPAAGTMPATLPMSAAGGSLHEAIAMQIQASNALLMQLINGSPAATGSAPAAPAVPAATAPAAAAPVVPSTSNSEPAPLAHGPFAPLQKAVKSGMSTAQKAYLDEFIAAYVAKTRKSKELAETTRVHYADPRTVMGFKTIYKELTYTLAGERSKGSHVWDVDGNEFVDCQAGFGAILFGHAPDFVLAAVRKQLDKSIDYGPQSPVAGRIAERFCALTGMERASFCNTGSEASLAAMRIARTVTGNDLIVMFNGSYHGIFNEVLVRGQQTGDGLKNMPVAPGIPASSSDNILLLDYDDPQSLAVIRERAEDIAGVIVEPVQSRHCEIQPREFLHKLRAVTKELDIPLIFDEIITGFRLHPRGAQGWFGVDADLACYGKIVGGGFPIGVIAGKSSFMDALDGGPWQFGDDSFPEVGVTYFAGTFVRHPVALAAVDAVLQKLEEEGPALQERMNRKTAVFAERVNRCYRQMGVPIELSYFGSAFFIRYRGDKDYEFLFYHHLRYFGAFHIWGNRPGLLTDAHTAADMDFLFGCFEKSARKLQEHGFLPSPDDGKPDTVPFTNVQTEIWLAIAQGEETAAAYNEQVMFEIDRSLDPEVMELVMDKVTNRHPGLRAIPSPDGTGLLTRHYCPPAFEFMDLSGLGSDEREARIHDLAQSNIDRGFDFTAGPLLRTLLLKTGEASSVICVAVSHLVCDGWSLEILMEDISGYYTGIVQSRFVSRRKVVSLEEIQAIDLAQRESGDIAEARDYWLSVYGEPLPPDLDLPLDHPRPRARSYKGERHAYYLEAELSDRIRKTADQEDCTAFVFLLAVYLVLLNRLSGQDDLVVGAPAAGQPALGLNDAVTHAVSLLPLRFGVDRESKFRALLTSVREIFMDAMDNQSFAYGELLKDLTLPRDNSRTPLMSASFNVDQAFNPIRMDGALARFVPAPRGHAKVDLLFTLTDEGDRYLLEVDRNADIIASETIDRWVAGFQSLLVGVLNDPDCPLGRLPLLSPDDEELLFREWNRPGDDGRREENVIALFEQQVDANPDQMAAQCSGVSLSYRQLDDEANRFAHFLAAHEVSPGSLVGVALDRSIHLPVVLLGILKAGAGYISLDPDLPASRVSQMVSEAKVRHLVVASQHVQEFSGQDLRVMIVDQIAEELAALGTRRPSIAVGPEDQAYVIYTSGSTGRPKGVSIDHGNMGNLLVSLRDKPGLSRDDRVLAITTTSFDPSVIELFLPLVTGATLVVANSDEAVDAERLKSLLEKHQISFMNATPTMWRLVLDNGWRPAGPFKALCGGEAMSVELARDLSDRVGELWNMYGPTEASVAVCGYHVPQGGASVCIGRPLAEARLYVLDAGGAPVLPGVVGELFIGGPGLAKGYVGRDDLTADRFISAVCPQLEGQRLYRTGDLVRYLPDGNLEFLGRNDLQVKIRGLRIELGEIESVLGSHEAVAQCMVSPRVGLDGDQVLVAFVVPRAGATIDGDVLLEHAQRQLPRYMVPQTVVPLDSLPLSANGKVDRKALKSIAIDSAEQAERVIVAPATELESGILKIWREILQIEAISVTDDFFALGGHSLVGIQMLARLRAELGVKIGLKQLFESATIRELAALAGNDSPAGAIDPKEDVIPRRTPGMKVPASAQQRRVWYLGQMEPSYLVAQYVSTALRLSGPVNVEAMQAASDAIISRHEALRTNFYLEDGELFQRVVPDVQFDMTPQPLSAFGVASVDELAELLISEATQVPDLENGRLFRIRLINTGPNEHVLAFTVHHMVFDGWSYDILYDEFFSVYNAYAQGQPIELPDPPIQYGDFSIWQQDWLASDEIRAQVEHSVEVLAGDWAPLDLPLDFSRPPTQIHTGVELLFYFDTEQVVALQAVAERANCTLFMVMIGLYTLTMARFSRQREVLIGSPISGRNQASVAGLIGFFVNTLVFRFQLNPTATFSDWLAEVKAVCLDVFGHQDAPFESIVQELNPRRDPSRSPVFQTLFIYQDVRNRDIHLHDLEIDNFNMERLGAQTDLDVWLKREADSLWGGLIYPTSLFKESSAQRIVDVFTGLAAQVAENPELRLAVLTAADRADMQQYEAWDGAKQDLPPGTVVDALRRTTTARAEYPAIVCGDRVVSYEELEVRSNRLAAHLVEQGVKRGSLVGVCLDRSEELLVGLQAVWKAGGAYVPLDPDYPQSRLGFMVETAGIEVLVTESKLSAVVSDFACRRIEIDTDAAAIAAQSGDPRSGIVGPDDLAYVIFTSGSTGNPKGVLVPHGAVLNFLQAMATEPGLSPDDRLLAVTTNSFDIHLLELFLPVFVGATVVVADRTEARDSRRLIQVLQAQKINVMQATPATWRMLIEAGWEGTPDFKILCGGEAFPTDLIEPLCDRSAEVWNMYGPTETTVWSTCHRIQSTDTIAYVGRPIGNTTIRILDEAMQPVPIGATGELFIGGQGVTKGYLGEPGLTREYFVPDPLAEGRILYRTGDLARYTENGLLECLGRTDDQLKVRGFRIEPGEIEAVLVSHESIKQAAVVLVELKPGDERLVAFVVLAPGRSFAASEVRNHLRGRVPDYMVPQHFVELAELPLSPAGKVDRASLPALFALQSTAGLQLAEPESETEIALHAIWLDSLGAETIGIDQDFFDVGGHSFLAAEIFSRIASKFGVDLPLASLFETRTIRDLARLIDAELYMSNKPTKSSDDTGHEEFRF